MVNDPAWPRARAWLEGEGLDSPVGSVSVLGVPLNASISPGRCDLAPEAVREAMRRLSTYDVEHGTDVRRLRAVDLGDLDVDRARPEDALEPVVRAMGGAVPGFEATVLLGGDNGVTRPGLRGMAEALGLELAQTGLLTLDAHLDVRHTEDGLHNGNPVRALLEDGLPGANVVQIGIASWANSAEYATYARGRGVRVVTRRQAASFAETVRRELEALAGRVQAVYVDVDVDVLDRAFAPACPGARPGGVMPWELADAVWECGRHSSVRVIDIVEVDPSRDANDVTTLVAGQCLLAFCSGLTERLA